MIVVIMKSRGLKFSGRLGGRKKCILNFGGEAYLKMSNGMFL